jgi:hypothetical protein
MKEEIRQLEVINSANGRQPDVDGQQQTKGSLQMQLRLGAGRKLKF